MENNQAGNEKTTQDANVNPQPPTDVKEGTLGTRATGTGDGGSSSQQDVAGSDGSGGRGSVAAGIEGASGDSVKGAQAMAENKEKE